MSSFFLRCTS